MLRGGIGIAVLLLFVAAPAWGVRSPDGPLAHPPEAAFTIRDPIVIQGDAGFTPENGVVGGTGTPADPYRISGWDIDATGRAGVGMSYTSAYFVLSDVRIACDPAIGGLGVAFYQVDNGRIDSATVTGCSGGISIESSLDDTIVGSHVSGVTSSGVSVTYSGRIAIQGNVFEGGAFGVSAYGSQDLRVAGNRVSNATSAGISVREAPRVAVEGNVLKGNREGVLVFGSGDARVVGNEVDGSEERGIYLDGSSPITVTDNNVSRNKEGIYLYFSSGAIHHNRFIDNLRHSYDTLQQYWDDGYPSGGNWWYDYPGPDECSGPNQDVCPDQDGIGDTPYVSDTVVRDRYPLIPPTRPPIAAFAVTPAHPYAEEPATFDASAARDVDGTIVDYAWDFGDGGSGLGRTATHTYGAPGFYRVVLTVTDDDAVSDKEVLDVFVVERLPLVPYEHPAGFRLPRPRDWTVQEDVTIEGVTVELYLEGPTVAGFATSIAVDQGADGTVREDGAYLRALVNATFSGIQAQRPEAILAEGPTFETYGGHAAVAFVVEYGTTSVRQKIAVIVSDPDDRYWAVILTSFATYYPTTDAALGEMLSGFAITGSPSTRGWDPALFGILVAIAAALGIAGFLAFLVIRQWKRPAPQLGYGPSGPAMAPAATDIAPRTCPACGFVCAPDALFCGGCGDRLPTEGPPPTLPGPPQSGRTGGGLPPGT